ncbi:GNAT family N-acetyltransferase [Streptomyces litchfieldiae]|uniref:GNAT family N-acetyltransferase n=1 Tax=Streptomyces litchfieldiae TaxID=3075543 RepID=A0ABU2MNG3_9ACTN|nr:GNAT family N-acetyltransferase [Streptomyces sp. DSM 44938]MDT0342991.1 GNAT family N-acetyltransferase [Streptomyces sp. DSM 44938]
MSESAGVRIAPWGEDDFELLRRANAPEMMAHLGGPESEEKLRDRHRRYLGLDDTGRGQMFSVRAEPTGERVGTVGFWEREWRDETVYEAGWSVLPEYQGRGLATAAAREVARAAAEEGGHRFLHAFPSVENPGSNAVCAGAGFTLLGPCDFEYPPGRPMRCNDWRLDLVEFAGLGSRVPGGVG